MKVRLFGRSWYFPVGLALHYTRRRELRGLLDYLAAGQGHCVGDVACGDGYVTRKFAGDVAGVYGADLSRYRVGEAIRSAPPNSHFAVARAEELPWRGQSLDRVISVCALEHFEDDEEALREISRVLRPGGVAALSVDSLSIPGIPEEHRRWHREKYHVNNYYTHDELLEKMSKAGLQVTDWRYLVSSPLAERLIRVLQRRRIVGFLLYPLAYPLTLILDRLARDRNVGQKLMVRAVAVEDSGEQPRGARGSP